jgi:hypothetical protein
MSKRPQCAGPRRLSSSAVLRRDAEAFLRLRGYALPVSPACTAVHHTDDMLPRHDALCVSPTGEKAGRMCYEARAHSPKDDNPEGRHLFRAHTKW